MQYGEGGRIDCIHLIERVESWAGHEHFGSMLRSTEMIVSGPGLLCFPSVVVCCVSSLYVLCVPCFCLVFFMWSLSRLDYISFVCRMCSRCVYYLCPFFVYVSSVSPLHVSCLFFVYSFLEIYVVDIESF